MSDTANFQVEFTAYDLSKLTEYVPDNFGNYASEEEWRIAEKSKGIDWADNTPDAIYMATATCHNGV
jgi:hypothetical protein